MAEVRTFGIGGLLELIPARHGDDRGFFSEVWSVSAARAAGIDVDWVQDNHSWSRERGILRGLHFQSPPAAQAKLVRVSRGRIFDVVVDLRRGSPTFGKWEALELSAEKWNQLFVPEGLAHGFLTLELDCEVQYKVSAPYSRDHDRAIAWNDPAISIAWPLDEEPLLSNRDRAAPLLADCETGF